jgi:2-dehydropantoate 2-reductase
MKHAILGAGAIGGLIGTALGSLVDDVTMIVRPDKLSSYPRTLSLERPSGFLTAPAKAASRLTYHVDVMWIATKTYQLEAALEVVEAMPAIVVPLLNGVDHIQVLRSQFGHDRVVPATIPVETERTDAGHFVERSPVRLGIAASGEAMLKATVADLQDLGFACQFVANEKTLLWSKLCFLGPFALVTSASGRNLGEILSDPDWKAKLDSAFAETRAVAKASGAEIDRAKVQAILVMAPATMRSSMAKDHAAGRRLELDAIGGPIVRGGANYGIPVPCTASHLCAKMGDVSAAETALRDLFELYRTGRIAYLSSYREALVYAGLRSHKSAICALERAVDERCDLLIHLRIDPRWAQLRRVKGFDELANRVGIPTAGQIRANIT